MKIHSFLMIEPPRLTYETVRELRTFLEALIDAFDQQSAQQLREWYDPPPLPESLRPRERDLFDNTDHAPPPF